MNSPLLSSTQAPEPEVPANEGSYISLIRDFYTEDGTPNVKHYIEVTGDSRGAPAQAIDRNTVKNLARKMEACLEGKMPRESFRYQSNTKHRRRPVRTKATLPKEAEEILGGPSNASGFELERPSELLSEKAQGKQKSIVIEDEGMNNMYASAEEYPIQEIPLRAVEEASSSAVPNQGPIPEFIAISEDVEMIVPEAPLLPAMPFILEAPVYPEASICLEGQFNSAAPFFSEAPPDMPIIRDEDIQMADVDVDMAEPNEYTPDLQHMANWETQANTVTEISIPAYETTQPLYVFEELHGPEYFFNEAFFIHTMNATTFTPLEGTYCFDIWQGKFVGPLSWIIMDSSILPCQFDCQLYRWVSLKEIPTPWPTRFVPPTPPPTSDVCQPHSEDAENTGLEEVSDTSYVCQPHTEEAEDPCVEEVSDIVNLSEPSSEHTPPPALPAPEWPRVKKRTRDEYEAERPVERKRRKLKHTSVRIDEYCLKVLMIEAPEESLTEAKEERVIEVGEGSIIEDREDNLEAGGERRIEAREESITEVPRPTRRTRSKKSRSSRRRDSAATSTAALRPPVPDIVPSTDVWPWTMIKPIAEFLGWV